MLSPAPKIRKPRACFSLLAAAFLICSSLPGLPQGAGATQTTDQLSQADPLIAAGKLDQAIALLEELRQRRPQTRPR